MGDIVIVIIGNGFFFMYILILKIKVLFFGIFIGEVINFLLLYIYLVYFGEKFYLFGMVDSVVFVNIWVFLKYGLFCFFVIVLKCLLIFEFCRGGSWKLILGRIDLVLFYKLCIFRCCWYVLIVLEL